MHELIRLAVIRSLSFSLSGLPLKGFTQQVSRLHTAHCCDMTGQFKKSLLTETQRQKTALLTDRHERRTEMGGRVKSKHRYLFSTTTDRVEDKKANLIHIKQGPMYSLAVRRPDVLVQVGQIYTSGVRRR